VVALNHTIIHVRDKELSARFLAELFGLPEPRSWGPFCMVELAGGVTLDYCDHADPQPTHYAFLVSDAEFDAILGRIRERGLTYWADPAATQPGEINHHFGGRGVYWADPDGHYLEIITKPYEL
jgi:catechol 2,3-dioxygenase-like lactoylglutathione lyase family enzyme